MMNKKTRRLSKMPDEVRAEICPYFLERSAIKDEGSNMQKINKLDDSAEHVRSGLTVSICSYFLDRSGFTCNKYYIYMCVCVCVCVSLCGTA
jgi:hypothetical protein